ncbi:Esterase ybfF [Nitrincola lacisaponensis]|uniref:Esterase ybfF n=1 Tax=Nitrincola lacisaponensis TaxID=267850 RepID=A0A063XZI5_9GAMM|nr:alpha/beta fold hydrolase [Nitrincola lacisaponensis]KDE39488.1 Esterase ybfF [Nitrincola lacisaponensis]
MKLHYQRTGQGTPLIILHGLFGTLENWGAQIKALAEHHDVIAVDLRNHGRSPHSMDMSYPLMAEDVIELMDDLQLSQVNLMGHSMGGKVAMQMALSYPQRIARLLLVDIAPVSYPPHHEAVFKGLFSIDLTSLTSRADADKQLQVWVEEAGVRAFLLKNLYRNEQGQFAWRMNLDCLRSEYDAIAAAPEGSAFTGPTRFIKGGLSHYLKPEYTDAVRQRFPNADVKVIEDAGHWPHAEKPALFTRLVDRFFSDTQT